MAVAKPIYGRSVEEAFEWLNMIVYGPFGIGKALRNDQKVWTDKGLIPIGEITSDHKVYDSDGLLCNITGIYPQEGLRPCYEVEFSDGNKVICDEEHLWIVQNIDDRHSDKYHTVSLKTILTDKRWKLKKDFPSGASMWNVYIPMCSPVYMKEQSIPIDPYIMGLLLGDGCFSSGCSISFSNTEEDLLCKMDEYMESIGENMHLRSEKHTDIDYTLTGLKDIIRDLGLLGCLSDTKFIPDIYLYNSKENRLKLLQGLIDTDGEISPSKSAFSFASTSYKLAEGVKFLVESLGGTAVISGPKNSKYTYKGEKKEGKLHYRVQIKSPKGVCFASSLKFIKQYKEGQTTARRTIRKITKVSDAECTCIKVASKHRSFLCENFIVTHNTHLCGSAALVPDMRDVLYLSLEGGERGLKEVVRMMRAQGLNPSQHIFVIPIHDFKQFGNCYQMLKTHLQFRDIKTETADFNLRKLEAQLKGYTGMTQIKDTAGKVVKQALVYTNRIENINAELINKEVTQENLKDIIPIPMRFRTVIIDSLTEAQKYKMYDSLGIDPGNKALESEFDKPEFDNWYDSKEAVQFLVRRYRDLPIHSLFVASAAQEQDNKKQMHYQPEMPGNNKGIQGFVDYVGFMCGNINEQKAERRIYFTGGFHQGIGHIEAKHRFGSALKGVYATNVDMRDIWKLDQQS